MISVSEFLLIKFTSEHNSRIVCLYRPGQVNVMEPDNNCSVFLSGKECLTTPDKSIHLPSHSVTRVYFHKDIDQDQQNWVGVRVHVNILYTVYVYIK